MDVAASGELAGRGNLDGDLSDGDFSCDLGGDGGGITTWPVPGMLHAAGRDAGRPWRDFAPQLEMNRLESEALNLSSYGEYIAGLSQRASRKSAR